jgi:hypothetical protein
MKLPSCPKCDTRIPFWTSQFRLRGALVCKGFEARLIYPKRDVVIVNSQATVACWLIYHRFDNFEERMAVVAVTVPLALIYIYCRLNPVIEEDGPSGTP